MKRTRLRKEVVANHTGGEVSIMAKQDSLENLRNVVGHLGVFEDGLLDSAQNVNA